MKTAALLFALLLSAGSLQIGFLRLKEAALSLAGASDTRLPCQTLPHAKRPPRQRLRSNALGS